MVAERLRYHLLALGCCSLAKISMVAEPNCSSHSLSSSCSLAKISMVAEPAEQLEELSNSCSLAKISMVAERYMESRAVF